jgi:hypothetical protein
MNCGFYIAYNKAFDYYKLPVFKIGFSKNIQERLTNATYNTCFLHKFEYKKIFYTEQAQKLEAAVKCMTTKDRQSEMVTLKLPEIIQMTLQCIQLLKIHNVTVTDTCEFESSPQKKTKKNTKQYKPLLSNKEISMLHKETKKNAKQYKPKKKKVKIIKDGYCRCGRKNSNYVFKCCNRFPKCKNPDITSY